MAHTETIIGWLLSAPVLVRRLSEIAEEDRRYGDDELPCMVASLLHPGRSSLAAGILFAVGVRATDADALWRQLSGGEPDCWRWMDDVDWCAVRGVVCAAPPLFLD